MQGSVQQRKQQKRIVYLPKSEEKEKSFNVFLCHGKNQVPGRGVPSTLPIILFSHLLWHKEYVNMYSK